MTQQQTLPGLPHGSWDVEARVSILEYRMDETERGQTALRNEYVKEHAALRGALQGIEKNLQAIKWIAVGAAVASLVLTQGPGGLNDILTKLFL
ncbi:MAG: hypothetical protein LCH89_00380 [Proteobacteria bacterium]|nr:hypothetical protein [Pseudomonadota bacterium]